MTAVETQWNLRRTNASRHNSDASADYFFRECRGMKKSQYAADHILQSYHTCIPERSEDDIEGDQYWILYIHGGYFRDPKVDSTSFLSALRVLNDGIDTQRSRTSSNASASVSSSPASSTNSLADGKDLMLKRVEGYASINYRLAPHPAYPQDDSVEDYTRRNAEFPDQIKDIQAAIKQLQARHGFGTKYVLCGHSVGATLAFLTALQCKEADIEPPVCVVGVNGIYDFPYIHETHPQYEPMTRNAIRPELYSKASPALYSPSEYMATQAPEGTKFLLSHSRDDALVDWDQSERMVDTLLDGNILDASQVKIMETTGKHDAIWKNGNELARTLIEAVQMVLSTE